MLFAVSLAVVGILFFAIGHGVGALGAERRLLAAFQAEVARRSARNAARVRPSRN